MHQAKEQDLKNRQQLSGVKRRFEKGVNKSQSQAKCNGLRNQQASPASSKYTPHFPGHSFFSQIKHIYFLPIFKFRRGLLVFIKSRQLFSVFSFCSRLHIYSLFLLIYNFQQHNPFMSNIKIREIKYAANACAIMCILIFYLLLQIHNIYIFT